MRTVIAGVPRAGKTTLASTYGRPVRHTDDLIGECKWSEASERIAGWFDASGPWTIEGVAAVRALRKWLVAHPDGRPCDEVIWLGTSRVETTRGQDTMAKGCATIWADVEPALVARGVTIRYPEP